MGTNQYTVKIDKLDRRIWFAQIGVTIALLISILLTLSSSISIIYISYCIVAYIGFFVVNIIGFSVIKKDNTALLLYAILSVFIWSSYVLKFALISFDPKILEATSIINVQAFSQDVVPKFLVLTPALALFFVGLWIGPMSKVHLKDKHVNLPGGINYPLLIFVLFVIIILKYIGQTFFDIGSPIKVGHGLPSLIIALYEFIVQKASIVLLNVLFFTVLYLRYKRGIMVISIALVLNVTLSLMVGWKAEMVLQALTLVYFYFELSYRVSQQARRGIFILSSCFIIIMLIVYPYVNLYRNATLQGLSVQAAINQAQQKKHDSSAETSTKIPKILTRVDGIGTYITAIDIGERRKTRLPISSLWSNQFSEMVKYELYGVHSAQSMSAFATTQFAALYLVGGSVGLYIGSFLLGLLFRNATSFLANYVFKYATTFHGYLPLLCFTWLSVLFSGGNLGLKLKELFVVIVSIFVIEKLVFLKRTTSRCDKYNESEASISQAQSQYGPKLRS